MVETYRVRGHNVSPILQSKSNKSLPAELGRKSARHHGTAAGSLAVQCISKSESMSTACLEWGLSSLAATLQQPQWCEICDPVTVASACGTVGYESLCSEANTPPRQNHAIVSIFLCKAFRLAPDDDPHAVPFLEENFCK